MAKTDQLDYLGAVHCLRARPAQTSGLLYPGARSRYDDFQALHIDQTDYIHFCVSPLKINQIAQTSLVWSQ